MNADDGGGPKPVPPSKPDVSARVDAYLSRKAQLRLDPQAQVKERANGDWYLIVPGKASLLLGESFGRAKEALWALIVSERVRRGSKPDADD